MRPEPARTLWIVPKWPFPAQDGARVATVSLLANYCALGGKTDLLAVAGDDEACDFGEARSRLGVERCFVARRPSSRSLATMALGAAVRPWVPITMRNYALGPVREEIAKVLAQGPWDAIVYDGLHPAIHSASFGKYARPRGVRRVIYRAHNHETGIWERKRAQARNPAVAALLGFQATRVAAIEHSLAASADGVACVSSEDLEHFRARSAMRDGWVSPIGYDFGEPPPVPRSRETQVMFLGKMDWAPNREGLVWFMKEVWPRAAKQREDLVLAVAGSGDARPIRSYLEQPRVRFLGRVDDLAALYRDSAASLAPIFYGSGTRVKVIESARFGRACLSTSLGVEGVGLVEGTTYLRAETADEWVSQLLSLDAGAAERMGRAAHESLRERFDAAAVARDFAGKVRG